MRQSIAALVIAAGVAACAPTGGTAPDAAARAAPRPCFQPDRITNFTDGGGQRLYVRVFGSGVYAIGTGGCPDVASAHTLAITPTIGVSDRLCVGDSARIAVPNASFGPNPCIARVERALTEAEVEALPSNQRP